MRKGSSPAELMNGGLPFGRRLTDFNLPDESHPQGLLPAEAVLLACCHDGQPCSLGKGRPTAASEANTIRAGFLRFLALGGDADNPVHETGVRLEGAYVDGEINLDHARTVLPVALTRCHVEGRLSAFNARLADLTLDGSSLTGVILEDATVEGSVLMRHGCRVVGETRLTGARIGGDLDCTAADLINPKGDALAARRIEVKRSVFICDGFIANGRVKFSSARIGGDLACHGGKFIARRQEPGSAESRQPYASDALILVNAIVEGVAWLGPWPRHKEGQVEISGSLNLQGAHFTTFVDHHLSWPPAFIETDQGRLRCIIQLNGFVYDRLGSGAPTDSATRERWLLQQQPERRDHDYHPQPFEQLMRVLREMGYEQDARRIGLLKESLMHPMRVRRASIWSRPLVRLTGYAWGILAGYGYRSHRLFVLLLLLWLGCTWFFNLAEMQGLFAPADAEIWADEALRQTCERTRWTVCEKTSHLLVFNAATYAADVIFPFIDLQQQSQWMPLFKPVTVTIPGMEPVIFPAGTVHLVSWLATMIGTACVILLGAILTGLLQRE